MIVVPSPFADAESVPAGSTSAAAAAAERKLKHGSSTASSEDLRTSSAHIQSYISTHYDVRMNRCCRYIIPSTAVCVSLEEHRHSRH